VAFASFQLLQSWIQVMISSFFSISLLKNLDIFLVNCSGFKSIFINIFSSIYFILFFSSFSQILFKYSHIALAVLKIIGQLNQKCVNKSGQDSV
jgi:hypothetical protein